MDKRVPKTFDNFQQHAQLLLASRIFSEYLDTKATIMAARQLEFMNDRKTSDFPLEDIEPEYFCEQWIKERVVGGNEEWRNGVFSFFIKLLANYPKAMSGGE